MQKEKTNSTVLRSAVATYHITRSLQSSCWYLPGIKRLRWSRGRVWPLVPKFAGSHPAEVVGFLGRKNPQQVPCRSFTACTRSLNVTWNSEFRQNYQTVPPPPPGPRGDTRGVVVAALLVVVWRGQTTTNNAATANTPTVKPEAANAVVSS